MPRRPLTCPPTVKLFVVHETATVMTLLPPTLPVGLATVHVWLGAVGCVYTVTSYEPPLATGVENANEPFAVTAAVAVPFARTSPEPASLLTVPPTVNAFVPQLTMTLVTAPLTTVPVAPLTLHVCEGEPGSAETLME